MVGTIEENRKDVLKMGLSALQEIFQEASGNDHAIAIVSRRIRLIKKELDWHEKVLELLLKNKDYEEILGELGHRPEE